MDKYILDDSGNPVKELDLLKWGKWFESADRTVARDEIGDVSVSTVFLGIDHSFDDGSPVLYETMIFGGAHDQYQERCGNRVAALAMQDRAVALVRDSDNPNLLR